MRAGGGCSARQRFGQREALADAERRRAPTRAGPDSVRPGSRSSRRAARCRRCIGYERERAHRRDAGDARSASQTSRRRPARSRPSTMIASPPIALRETCIVEMLMLGVAEQRADAPDHAGNVAVLGDEHARRSASASISKPPASTMRGFAVDRRPGERHRAADDAQRPRRTASAAVAARVDAHAEFGRDASRR